MKKNSTTIISLLVIVVIIIGIFFYFNKDKKTTFNPKSESSIVGCYVATLDKDVYTLKVESQKGENFIGTLSFKNFQKDSSQGTYSGTYKDGILLGIYSFDSEGMHSNAQTIFKKEGDTFIRGFGSLDNTGSQFTDLSNTTYDTNQIFKLSFECSQN